MIAYLCPVADPEDLEDAVVRTERHCDTLCSTFFTSPGHAAEHASPSLTRLVVRRHFLAGDGADGGIVDVEIVFARLGFLEKLSAAVAEEFVAIHNGQRCQRSIL